MRLVDTAGKPIAVHLTGPAAQFVLTPGRFRGATPDGNMRGEDLADDADPFIILKLRRWSTLFDNDGRTTFIRADPGAAYRLCSFTGVTTSVQIEGLKDFQITAGAEPWSCAAITIEKDEQKPWGWSRDIGIRNKLRIARGRWARTGQCSKEMNR